MPSTFYPAPLSLRDLVETYGLSVMRSFAQRVPGATAIGPKKNEKWRFAVGECVVLGYASSVVVSGTDARQMRQIADHIRRMAEPTPEQLHEAQTAAALALVFVREQIAYRWHDAIDERQIADVLLQWSALDPMAEALAYRELERRCPDVPMQKWYVNALQVMLHAYTVGVSAGFEELTA